MGEAKLLTKGFVMRYFLAPLGLGLFLCSFSAVAAAPVDIGGGIEQFSWQELDDAGGKLLKESGQRLYVSVASEEMVSDRWTYAFRGRLYSGTVKCDGAAVGGVSCSGNNADYDGISAIIDFTGRLLSADGQYSDWGLRFGIGGETWRHHLQGSNGYSDTYTVGLGRLGIAYTPPQGWFGEAGAKYPLAVSEKVDLYDGVTLNPQGAFSLYATVGYNFNWRWSVKGYYDSYRFKASDSKALYDAGTYVSDISQPESKMDSLGINLGFFF